MERAQTPVTAGLKMVLLESVVGDTARLSCASGPISLPADLLPTGAIVGQELALQLANAAIQQMHAEDFARKMLTEIAN